MRYTNENMPLLFELMNSEETGSEEFKEGDPVPVMNTVIKKMLENAVEAYVYKGRKDSFYLYGRMNEPVDLEKFEFLTLKKGKYEIDLNDNTIADKGELWNASAHRRGSIFVVLPKNFDFKDIFSYTSFRGRLDNPNSGNNPAAIKKCQLEVEVGRIAVCFSASNGIEDFMLYADEKKKIEIECFLKSNKTK
jgi:hypothetical protein